jgi:hypothetical protein
VSRLVRICNPLPGGSETCTLSRAKRYCSKGRAEWIEDKLSIQFTAHYLASKGVIAQGFDPPIAPPKWESCYRNTEAPVMQPSIEWLASRSVFRPLCIGMGAEAI